MGSAGIRDMLVREMRLRREALAMSGSAEVRKCGNAGETDLTYMTAEGRDLRREEAEGAMRGTMIGRLRQAGSSLSSKRVFFVCICVCGFHSLSFSRELHAICK